MQRVIVLCFVLAMAAAAFGRMNGKGGKGGSHEGGIQKSSVVLAFGTMYGVDEAFLGETNALRGLEGDELPWKIAGSVHGRLTAGGRLKIRVRGLVFTDDPEVPAGKQNKNDETEFRAVVSCLEESNGQVVTTNVTTQGFRSTPTGNADIDAQVTLPGECIAPMVFVIAGSEDKWFAVSGVSTESE